MSWTFEILSNQNPATWDQSVSIHNSPIVWPTSGNFQGMKCLSHDGKTTSCIIWSLSLKAASNRLKLYSSKITTCFWAHFLGFPGCLFWISLFCLKSDNFWVYLTLGCFSLTGIIRIPTKMVPWNGLFVWWSCSSKDDSLECENAAFTPRQTMCFLFQPRLFQVPC